MLKCASWRIRWLLCVMVTSIFHNWGQLKPIDSRQTKNYLYSVKRVPHLSSQLLLARTISSTLQNTLFGQVVETRRPFGTYADLTHFFNDRLARTLKWEGKLSPRDSLTPLDGLTTFDNSQILVLTHQDLNPRNFIVGDDGHLWLVD